MWVHVWGELIKKWEARKDVSVVMDDQIDLFLKFELNLLTVLINRKYRREWVRKERKKTKREKKKKVEENKR